MDKKQIETKRDVLRKEYAQFPPDTDNWEIRATLFYYLSGYAPGITLGEAEKQIDFILHERDNEL